MKYSIAYAATVVPFTFCTMASNIDIHFYGIFWVILYLISCVLQNKKTGRMFTDKHTKHLSNHQSG